MPILSSGTWNEVTFHPITHPSWTAALEQGAWLSNRLLLIIMQGQPTMVYSHSDDEAAVTDGYGVGLGDAVIASAIPANSFTMTSKSPFANALRAAKDGSGNLYVVSDFNTGNLVLRRYEAADVVDFKKHL